MRLLKFVKKKADGKTSIYHMLETDVNGKSVRILVNFPKGKNNALINYISDVVYVEPKPNTQE